MVRETNLIFLGGEDVSSRIEISKKFIKLGYNINIIGTEKEDKFIQNSIDYEQYSFSREFGAFSDIKSILNLRKILKEKEENTIVHAFDTKPTIFLPLASIGLKNIKVSRTITGMGRIFTEDNLKNRLLTKVYNIVQKSIKPRVDFTIFQNDDDAKYFSQHNLSAEDKSKTIKSSGIDLQNFSTEIDKSRVEKLVEELSIDKSQKTFILVSRMVKQKGILTYLKAAKLCYEEGYRYNFLLVGQLDTDESIKLEEIEAYGDFVNYLGRREDIKELLSLSDIFVLPTYYREGVPRVLLEASAMGLGLITTNMPGCKDVVTDEYNGKLMEIENEKDLCSKMIYMAENRDKLEIYQKNAKVKVEEFDLDRVVENYHNVYKKIGV
ncbi:glycosyltransferase family 4 protein [Sulfurovum sp. bin170]|uniref:glycosyltransferase n=1 Tax=Sulfurovum sp. bin170 TaxID=2695268 RepID=UPI0013DED790|nr:glycosyltransferase [Sulfurovum sp. bin170]NEW60639.1 glycosyltransferase family 4 protein [Sulfurovum sp. bin170]